MSGFNGQSLIKMPAFVPAIRVLASILATRKSSSNAKAAERVVDFAKNAPKEGAASVKKMAMIPIVIMSSISVNPLQTWGDDWTDESDLIAIFMYIQFQNIPIILKNIPFVQED